MDIINGLVNKCSVVNSQILVQGQYAFSGVERSGTPEKCGGGRQAA
jgi:hypothetical protein